jgi:hypothetical protein
MYIKKFLEVNNMKKALSLILALVMCFALIPMTAFAYGNDWIQLEKDNFDPGETMTVTVKGITQQMVEDWACIYIAKKDRLDSSLSGCGDLENVGENVVSWFEAPTEPGEYAVVLLSKWWQNGEFDDLFVSSLTFTVGKNAQEGEISLDKNAYKAMDKIIVSCSGITEQMENSKATLLIFAKGEAHSGDKSLWIYRDLKAGDSTIEMAAPNQNGEFEVRLYTVYGVYNDDTFVMAVPFSVSGASSTSDWANAELEKANQLGLIPDCLKGQDLTKPITRREFAAVSVKLYENLTGTLPEPAEANPFTDTKDAEVLKAYNVGITAGTAADKFSPDVLLNREQAATMLTRVLKAAYIEGWTLTADADYTFEFAMPAPFADDANISGWAKPSVYFMAANKIINGTGDNMFSPRATTAAEEAALYASATREQALAIAVRIVENLKDIPLNYNKQGKKSQKNPRKA